MWRQYFPEAQIVGFDIKDFEDPAGQNIKIIKGDQKLRKDLIKISNYSSEIDVIIDDALHASEHQQISLSFLFKYLKPGGLYFIEDLNYQPEECLFRRTRPVNPVPFGHLIRSDSATL